MVYQLPFSQDALPVVQSFNCGSERWAQPVNEWIKRSDGDCALSRIASQGRMCKVWLYSSEPKLTPQTLVGYGSLGSANWPFPPEKRQDAILIPFFGVNSQFQGKVDLDGTKFAKSMFQDLHDEALQIDPAISKFCLYVDPMNERGIAFWEKRGFKFHPTKTYTDPDDGIVYKGMFLNLR